MTLGMVAAHRAGRRPRPAGSTTTSATTDPTPPSCPGGGGTDRRASASSRSAPLGHLGKKGLQGLACRRLQLGIGRKVRIPAAQLPASTTSKLVWRVGTMSNFDGRGAAPRPRSALQHHAVLEQHLDRLLALQRELLAVAELKPGRARLLSAALRQDEDLAHGDGPAARGCRSASGRSGDELELTRRGDAEGMTDGRFDLGAGGRQGTRPATPGVAGVSFRYWLLALR